MAALRSFDEPLVLLLGGRDKKLPWDELAALVNERVKAAVLFGEAGPLIEAALTAAGVPAERRPRHASLAEALPAAAALAEAGRRGGARAGLHRLRRVSRFRRARRALSRMGASSCDGRDSGSGQGHN